MLEVLDWGLIDYQTALKQQLELVNQVAEKKGPGFLILCSHPPVVTTGRKTQAGDVFGWQGELVEVSRGGRATYHGPSQLVVYPILSLEEATQNRPVRDINLFLRNFENSISQVLALYGLEATGKSGPDETGVWVNDHKIASLGIAVKSWVTYHGAAINLFEDPLAFTGMKPCGFDRTIMTSLEKLTGQKPDLSQFKLQLVSALTKNL